MTTKTNVYQELARLEGERDAAIAARAAEAAQHRQEKDTLRTMATRLTCWRCGTAAFQPNERCDSHLSWMDRLQTEVEHHNAWRKRADEAEARLAAVEAERDAERQRWMDARAREIEHSIRADCAEAERDRLKAALAKADEALKRITAGQEDCGDPGTECPLHNAHKTWHPVSEALAMIAALTPQGQSTDGETR